MLADATEGTNTFRVSAYNGSGTSSPTTGSPSVVTYCFGSAVTGYAQWLADGRPLGWCDYPRQCHGDADGLQEGKSPNVYYVGNADLTILKNNWNQNPAPDCVH
jgi:hypothetical protein